MLLALLGAAWAACTFEQPVSALVDAMERAEAAYADVDVDAFQQATVEVDFLVPCLDAPLAREQVARLHRLRGIGYHTAKRERDLIAAFRAARVAAPDFVPSTALFPEGFVLRERYLNQPTESRLGPRLPRPAKGELVVDGVPARARPEDAAALVQVVMEGDLVRYHPCLPPTAYDLRVHPASYQKIGDWTPGFSGTELVGAPYEQVVGAYVGGALVRRLHDIDADGVFDDYGAPGDDADGDGWTTEQEFAARTDPEAPDTDGDGLIDPNDPEPLGELAQLDQWRPSCP